MSPTKAFLGQIWLFSGVLSWLLGWLLNVRWSSGGSDLFIVRRTLAGVWWLIASSPELETATRQSFSLSEYLQNKQKSNEGQGEGTGSGACCFAPVHRSSSGRLGLCFCLDVFRRGFAEKMKKREVADLVGFEVVEAKGGKGMKKN